MRKYFMPLILAIITLSNVMGQEVESQREKCQDTLRELNDGPYVFIENNELIEKTIVDGKVISTTLKPDAYATIYESDKSVFTNVEKIVAISDFHGQYDPGVEILKNNRIIDKNLNWDFGKGHLVIVGDIFNRGDKVNELLWLVYKLENQAEKAGGKVHFILGNHEYMILHKDFRYVNEKHLNVAKLLNLDYDELYSNTTILGKWLRTKPTILRINHDLFLHGGIASDFLTKVDFNIEAINDTMRKSIDRSKKDMKKTDFYKTYYRSPAPIWYRGYFRDNLEDSEISAILKKTNSRQIIVGHTSDDKIVNLFDNRIFGVDSKIKKGENGEILFIIKNQFYRGTKDGKCIKL